MCLLPQIYFTLKQTKCNCINEGKGRYLVSNDIMSMVSKCVRLVSKKKPTLLTN